jgi:hypothetical protein
MRELAHPTYLAKSAAMQLATSRNAGGDVACIENVSVLVEVVTAMGIDGSATDQWSTARPLIGLIASIKGNQLRHVMAVCAGQDRGGRRAASAGDERWCFEPGRARSEW